MSGGSSVNVSFRVTGNDVQSYMDRIQQRSVELSRSFLRNASQQSDLAKEQLRSYQQQLVALERQLRTETELAKISADINKSSRLSSLREEIRQRYDTLDTDLQSGTITRRQHRVGVAALDAEEQSRTAEIDDQHRQELNSAREQHRDNSLLLRTMRENVDTIRSTSAAELTQMRRGDESLIDAVEDDNDPNALLANRLASQQYIEEQAAEQEKGKNRWEEGTFGGLLKALAVDRVGGMVASIPQAQNELDYIKPFTSMMGMAMGGLMGIAADAIAGIDILGFGLGDTSFGALGAQLGEKAGEFAGSALERTYKGRDQLTSANYRVQALTGMSMGIDSVGGVNGLGGTGISSITSDLKAYGADFKQTSELQYKLAMAQATGRNLSGGAENMLALQQGLGINQDVFLQLTELLRSSKEQNRDVMKLVGGVASAGKSNIFAQDRTFLSEFMQKNFTNLQKTLLTTQNEVASGTTFDILRRFDSIGGPFSARDSRSQGLVSTIQGSLANPGSDNLKALSFIALRQQNPGMSFERLLEEQQKGLASPTYLKTMLGMVDRLGGDESMKIMNTAQMLGLGGNLAAARKLYENRGKLMKGEISTAELMGTGEYSQDSIRQLGKDQTSVYTVSTAEIENAFIRGATDGIAKVSEKMFYLFGDMIDELKKYMDEKMRSTLNVDAALGDRKSNATKTAAGVTGGSMLGGAMFGLPGMILGGATGYFLSE